VSPSDAGIRVDQKRLLTPCCVLLDSRELSNQVAFQENRLFQGAKERPILLTFFYI